MEKSQDITITHLGIIADGNRRWARERNLPTLEGHKKGLDAVENLVEACSNKGIKFVTFYLFSTENWNRSKEEVSYLMDLFLKRIKSLAKKMAKNNVKLLFLGGEERLSSAIKKAMKEALAITAECTGMTTCFCFNYGGKQEIADAAKAALAKDGEITPETIENNLYHPEVPACDMIVRPSGEQRLSGFMLWRSAYAEFLFLPKFFPEMQGSDIDDIIVEYHNRHRRFGK